LTRRRLWLSILLALAGAVGARAAEPERLPAIAAADETAALDLSFDPDLPTAQATRRTAPRARARPQRPAEVPFSLGVDIKTRPEVGNGARQSASDPTLTDEVEGVVKRSTFGVTGTYHF
jgi:hypothetical protein